MFGLTHHIFHTRIASIIFMFELFKLGKYIAVNTFHLDQTICIHKNGKKSILTSPSASRILFPYNRRISVKFHPYSALCFTYFNFFLATVLPVTLTKTCKLRGRELLWPAVHPPFQSLSSVFPSPLS